MLAPAQAFAQAEFTPADAVELNQGPLIAPSNIVGMGGAYIAIAEGAGAMQLNPAAVANRYPHNGEVWFDWDWALDWLIVGITDVDFENNRRPIVGADRLSIVTGALNFNLGRLGLGLTAATQSLAFGLPEEAFARPQTEYSATTAALSAGYSFMDGQLVFGAQLVSAIAAVTRNPDGGGDVTLMQMGGLGLAAGAVARPTGQPYRVGFTVRTEMVLKPDEVAEDTMGVVVPRAMIIPWQLGAGVSYAFGSRAPNRTSTYGDLEDVATSSTATTSAAPARERTWAERAYLTVAVDVLLIGKSNASGFEAWADRERQPAGASTTLAVRAGAESEFWPDRMRARLGGYYEPSRFEAIGRPHLTAGFDLRLGEVIWNWRTGAAVDLSFNYINVMLSLGFWYGST